MTDELLREVTYRTSRSSGPGGQHVNKTESRVELHWNLEESVALNDRQKSALCARLGRRVTPGGVLILASQKYRSQIRNREEVTLRFLNLIKQGLSPEKKRIRTRPTRSSVEKRLKAKKERSEKKQRRKDW